MVIPHHEGIQSLEMKQIVKRFPGVLAIDQVDFDVQAGEVHALLGENGAGKSTLMKILYGLYSANAGEIFINGQPASVNSPRKAIELGIGMIHQHFMLVPSLTVAENIAMGLRSSRGLLLDIDIISERVRKLSAIYNLDVDPDVPIWQLSVGEQQRVEILRALYKDASLLILDEPTAVLTPQEVQELFKILRRMQEDGHSLIFISHKLKEVLAISDRITVLRDGKRVDTIPANSATRTSLAQMMVGREVVLQYQYESVEIGKSRLTLENIHADSDRGDAGLVNINLNVHSSEIVGIAGVSGNGQQELAQVIAGLRPSTQGDVYLDGERINVKSANQRSLMGLSYIPEERMIEGVIKDFSVSENAVLHGYDQTPFAWKGIFLNLAAIRKATQQHIIDYEIKTPSTETPVKSLSGGNIQKLVLARELSQNPRVLIAAQPTRGVDIGATEYIHRRLLQARKDGVAILLISEDLDEILALSDRILVMYEGQIVGEVSREEAEVNEIGLMMAGASQTD